MEENLNKDGAPVGRPLTSAELTALLIKGRKQKFAGASDPATAYIDAQEAMQRKKRKQAQAAENSGEG